MASLKRRHLWHSTSLLGATRIAAGKTLWGSQHPVSSAEGMWAHRLSLTLGHSIGCRNSYSLYCAELMANMKDVPSTERMVLCSQQWKLLSQKEKDAYHKKCDQVSG